MLRIPLLQPKPCVQSGVIHRRRIAGPWSVVIGMLLITDGFSQDQPPAKVAPPNHVVLSDTIDGWYLVPKELKESFDATLTKLEALQADVTQGKVRASKAQAELAQLKQKLNDLRQALEARKVHVVGSAVYSQTETVEFELGGERRLAITGNQVHVIGWDEPKVKCVLKKIVLAPDDKPVENHLNAIKIVHKRARADFAGRTQEEIDEDEKKYLSGDGARLTEKQRASRRDLLAGIAAGNAIYKDYLARDVDQISIAGLDYENNPSITRVVNSVGGGAQHGSLRQRYGELTVYVPRCLGVVIRGAERGLVVEKLVASLTVTPDESTDSNHRGTFEVRDLTGDLHVRNFPIKSVHNVTGAVTITAKQDFDAESGISHYDSQRDLFPSRQMPVQIHHVTQAVNLQYGHVQLDLEDIGGRINVVNEFGDTHFVANGKLALEAHRIYTLGGNLEVELTDAAWNSVNVLAVTNHGGIRTNLDREEFEDFRLSSADHRDGARRDWRGFRKTADRDAGPFASIFGQVDRIRQVIDDGQRSEGLDLLNIAGRMTITRK